MNKFFESISLKANALDMYGEPAASADRTVKDLYYLPRSIAQAYYKQINEIMDDLDRLVEKHILLEKLRISEKTALDLKEKLTKFENDDTITE
jgi:uncharacterized protein YajQ (UPF0234 family)